IDAINYCRENDIPLLGICYGLQLMTVEFARNVLGLDAASEEFDEEASDPVVKEMKEQKEVEAMGGTMRLGAYEADVHGFVREIYGSENITERHRHRYEVNPEYEESLEENGFQISGRNPDLGLAEFVELPENDFFVGTQAHPEFTSRFETPNPLYLEFLRSCV
ncbi:MAG: gamma-glutamyl-gamma-aminobutyrate hydrolase family protein, partial [Desulfuromonadaceae bacterium]